MADGDPERASAGLSRRLVLLRRLRAPEARPPDALATLLARTAERGRRRVLAWAGAPLPLFRPGPPRRRRGDATGSHPGITGPRRARRHERPMHCHHEKLVIVDGEVAFVGGIDLTRFAGDRLDTSGHPTRGSLGWHDAATRSEGPAVADVAEHFRAALARGHGRASSAPCAARRRRRRRAPARADGARERSTRRCREGSSRSSRLPRRTARRANGSIYLENQFLWSSEIVDDARDKLRNPPDDRSACVVLLPAQAEQRRRRHPRPARRLVGRRRRRRALPRVHALPAGRRSAQPVYVHAKIGIVDDSWLTIGSANLNEHSLFNDTEVNVVTHDPALARATRHRLWASISSCRSTAVEATRRGRSTRSGGRLASEQSNT